MKIIKTRGMIPNKLSLILFAAIFIILSVCFTALANDDDAYNAYQRRIHKHLREQQNSAVINSEPIRKRDMNRYYTPDRNGLIGMELRLFYTLGRIHGYVVFLNNNKDYAIVGSGSLKVVLEFQEFPGGRQVLFFNITPEGFTRMTLYGGGTIIGYYLDSLNYGKTIPKEGFIKAEAECFQFKAGTEIYVK